jgi:hypothetical protein
VRKEFARVLLVKALEVGHYPVDRRVAARTGPLLAEFEGSRGANKGRREPQGRIRPKIRPASRKNQGLLQDFRQAGD